ncbi:Ig-like domain repeat protein, partial [Actinacidiphila sp. bgisy167]|uniref:Ig-like domain repeat protein n=1 Tax=Actinacidiphila sp. bgisy167 TaxID=3413797 RepID=UPI003D74541E
MSGVFPDQGPYGGGTEVTIVGRHLGGATAVHFGTRPAANVTVVDDQTLLAVTPAGSGAVRVSVTTPGGSAVVGTFFYLRAPLLSHLVPAAGPLAGGNAVVVSGTNLFRAVSVHFGDWAAFPTVLSDQQLLVTAPAAAVPGTVPVFAVAVGGVSNRLPYLYAGAPAIVGVSPAGGPVAGGTTVVIRGTGLGRTEGVTFAGQAATSVRAFSDTLVVAVVPAGVAGPADVTVTTPGGTDTFPGSFIYMADSSTALTSAPDPSVSGQSVTFTAAVTGSAGAGTPTGTVEFDFGDGAPTVTAPLVGGTATISHTYADPVGGPFTTTATYSGDTRFYPSTATGSHSVAQAATTTTVTATPDPSVTGQSIAFVARVAPDAPGAGVPTGTVTFDFGDGQPPVSVPVSGGTAVAEHTYSAAGPYPVSVSYSGDLAFAPSTGTDGHLAEPAASSTRLSVSPEPSAVGQAVAFTATVAAVPPGSGTPTGTVTFDFGDGTPPQEALLTTGAATTTHTFVSTADGPRTITATYSGDADFTASADQDTHTVEPAATTTVITSAPDPAAVGEQVAFTATVAAVPPGSGTPTGSVTFDFGDATDPVTVPLTGGTADATHAYPRTAAQPYPVTAVYQGTADFTPSSATATQTVTAAATTTAITSAPDPAAVGEQVAFTATVAAVPPGSGTPTGTVTFDFGDGTTAAATLTDGTATTVHTYTETAAEPYPVSAAYTGTADFAPSTGTATQSVTAAATTTAITSAPEPAVTGRESTFLAYVTAATPAAPPPTGTVTFDFGDGSPPQTVPVNGGVAEATHTNPAAGTAYTVTADYNGDADFSPSAAARTHAVTQAGTATTVSADPYPSVPGEQVTFTATVAADPPGARTPQGAVTFDFGDGSPPVAAPLTGGTATTTHTYPTAAGSPYTVTASYGADTDFLASTGTLTHTVDHAPTTTTVTADPQPSVTGAPVTVTATVTSTAPNTPTGTVTFDFGDGTAHLTALLQDGTATVVHAYPAGTADAGPLTITATYDGDENLAPSQGSTPHTVAPAPTTTSVTASAAPSAVGQTVTVFARVVALEPATGAPAGTVTFDFGDGTTPSTAPVTDGVATVTHAYTGTAGSPYTITATYDGSPDFAASSGTWAQQVDADVSTTSTTVTATPQPSPAGQAVTFTATVEVLPPAAGTATGTVTFDFGDGSPPVAAPLTGGTATTTHTYPSAAGSPYTVTARYSGDADFAGSAQITTQLVEPSASSTTLETAPAPSLSGQPVTLTATVTAAGPGTGTPTGTVTFDFGDGTPTQTAALSAGTATVLHAFSSSGSPYPLTATYHGDPDFLGSTASGTQTVTPAPTVTSVNAPGPSLTGQTVTFTATVTAPTAGAGTPAGSVTFDFGDATSPVTVPILAGVAVVPHTYATTAGSPYTVTAAYDGDADHTASTGTLPHTVHAAPTTTTVTLTPQPTTPGRPVTVTATVAPVAPGGGVPTGTVTFTFGADDPPITVPLDGSAATISHTDATPSLAPHTFTATYNGSADHTTSIGTATHTTVPDTTTTTVSADTAPTTVGQAVTFTATIAPTQPGALDPTGSVTFDFGDATGPVSAPVLAGTAVVSHTYATTAGSPYTVTAAYSGDTYATASTGTTTHTVQPAPTTLEIQSTSQTPVAGQPITVTAAVTPATPTTAAPTGTVTFDFGDGSPSVPVPLQAGTAAVAHTYPHASGTPYQITATYSGDTDFAPADGVHSQSVGRAATATATAVSTTPNPSPAGRPVTVTASVTPVAPATGTPTGTVTFDFADGGEPVTAVLTDGAATITHTYPHTAGSPFTLTATYSGDGDFTASSGTRTQSVARIPTATQVSDEPDPALTGQPVTVTATVATVPPGAATPTGTVTFDFGDHTDPQTVPLVAGTATAPHAYTASSGAQSTITATYSGDTDAEPSVGTTPHTTLRGVTTTMIDCSSDPSAAGQPITVTASVTAVPPSTGQPEGTVTFDPGDGTGPVTVELVGAIATYTHSYLHASPTPHQITAAYSGNADFRPSAGDHTHQVAPAATLTTISPPPEPTPVGQPATITATVTAAAPGSGTPTGTVTLDFGDGEPPVSALLVNGTVSLTHTYPHTAGTPFTVTATYGGDADFTSSTGAATTAVTPAATTTTLLTTPNPATPGTPVTVIARTTAATPQAGPPSGTVTIDFGDATPPVTVPLTGGVATATHTYDATASPYTLTASYGGDADFTASTATTTQTVTADTVLTTTTVTSSPQPSVTGQTVSFTATVTPVDSGGVPTGTVTFDFGDGQSPVTATLAGATVTVPYTYPHTTGSPYTVTA